MGAATIGAENCVDGEQSDGFCIAIGEGIGALLTVRTWDVPCDAAVSGVSPARMETDCAAVAATGAELLKLLHFWGATY